MQSPDTAKTAGANPVSPTILTEGKGNEELTAKGPTF